MSLLWFGRPEAHCRSTVGLWFDPITGFNDQPVDRLTVFGRPVEPSICIGCFERVGAWISFIAYDPMI